MDALVQLYQVSIPYERERIFRPGKSVYTSQQQGGKFQFPTNGNVSLDTATTTNFFAPKEEEFQFPTNGNVSLDLYIIETNRPIVAKEKVSIPYERERIFRQRINWPS